MSQVQAGRLQIAFSLATEVASVRQLLAKYADVPMSLMDGTLTPLLCQRVRA